MSGIHHDIHSEVENLVFLRDGSDVKIYNTIQAANSLLDREASEIDSFNYMGDIHVYSIIIKNLQFKPFYRMENIIFSIIFIS